MRHRLISENMKYSHCEKWLQDVGMDAPSPGVVQAFAAGWHAALRAAADLAYSVNNHDEHMQWVIPTGPNSDRCGWCACLETIAGLLDPDDYKGTETPGIHDNEKESAK